MVLNLSRKDIFTVLFGAFLSATSCLFYSEGSPTPVSLGISVVYILYATTLPIEEQLMLVALGLPNTKALGFYGISASICICAVGVIKYYLKEKHKPQVPILAIIYLIYSFQYLLRFDDAVVGIVMPVKTVLNILFFTCLASCPRVAKDSYNIGFKSALALFAGIVSAFWTSSMSVDDASRMAVEDNDPNILAIEVAFVLSYLCVHYYTENKIPKLLFISFVSVLGVISVFCGSRMGFILFAFVLVTSVLLNPKSIGKSIPMIVIFGVAIVAFLMSSVGQSIIELMEIRMMNLENSDNISNGRFDLWEKYIRVLNSDPSLWFFGMGKYTEYGIEDQAHNAIIESVAGIGLIGVLLLYTTYIRIYIKQYKASKRYHYLYQGLMYKIPFVVPLIGGLTLHSYTSIMNTTMLFIGVLCMTKPCKAREFKGNVN